MQRYRHARAVTREVTRTVTLLTVVGCLAAGCSLPADVSSTPPPTSVPSASPLPPSPEPRPGASNEVRNDLKSNPLRRAVRSGPLTVSVEYASPVKAWQPVGAKPLRVVLTAVNNGRKGQKIYLTRVNATVSAHDDAGPLSATQSMVDSTNLTPGFIVTFPNTYVQNFTVPQVDDGATHLVIDFNYELVMLIDPAARDYAKQTATDTLVVALS